MLAGLVVAFHISSFITEQRDSRHSHSKASNQHSVRKFLYPWSDPAQLISERGYRRPQDPRTTRESRVFRTAGGSDRPYRGALGHDHNHQASSQASYTSANSLAACWPSFPSTSRRVRLRARSGKYFRENGTFPIFFKR